jgi:hypothetical protein
MAKIRRYLPLIFLALCVIAAPGWPRSMAAQHLPPDFSVFWAAGNLALRHPELIYNDAVVTLSQVDFLGPVSGVRPWAYPPTALLPIIPFVGLPYEYSWALFVIASISIFSVAALTFFDRRKLLALCLILLSQPAIFAAINGQMAFLVAALVIGSLTQLRSAPIRAGILLGIAAAIKPQLLLFAPLALLADRQHRALIASACAGLGMVLISLAFGIARWSEWFAALQNFKGTVASLDILYRNVTPTGLLWFLGTEGWPLTVANLIFAGAGAWMAWSAFRNTEDLPIRLVGLAGGALFAAPYAMNYDLVLLVPAAAALLVRGDEQGEPLLPLLVGGLLLVSGGIWAPTAAIAFIVVTLAPYCLPGRLPVPHVSDPAQPIALGPIGWRNGEG